MKTYQYHYVYITTNLINNKRYIGLHKTNDLFDGYLGSGRIFLRAKKKHGLNNFSKVILEFCKDNAHLKEREIYWIDYYGAYLNRDYYNFTKGGESNTGRVTTKKMRKQISEKLKKYFKENPKVVESIKLRNSGKKMSKESLEKQLATRKIKGSNCVKLIVFSKDGTILKYDSIKEAGQIYGQTLLVYMKRDLAFFHDKLFVKLDYFESNMLEEEAINLLKNYKKGGHRCPIKVTFVEDNTTKDYDSINDFCNEYSFLVSCVSRAMKANIIYNKKYKIEKQQVLTKLKEKNEGKD